MSGSPASIRRTASPIIGWSSISRTVTLCSVRTGSILMRAAPGGWLDSLGFGSERAASSGRGPGRAQGGRRPQGTARVADHPGDPLGDVVEVEDLVGGAELDGGAGHAPDDARRFVLGDGAPAPAVEGQHP